MKCYRPNCNNPATTANHYGNRDSCDDMTMHYFCKDCAESIQRTESGSYLQSLYSLWRNLITLKPLEFVN